MENINISVAHIIESYKSPSIVKIEYYV